MSATVSPSTGTPYGVARVCRAWDLPRSTYYEQHSRRADGSPPQKRGPRTEWSDPDLVDKIRGQLRRVEKEWGIRGEGHRKVWARLRHDGVRTSKRRVLRLMREEGLLAPVRLRRARGPRTHDGTIRTERPDEIWGTDATRCLTLREGLAWVFVAVDHCTGECVGIHASSSGSRFEALEPLRQGVNEHFGELDAGVAEGLTVRHDNGSQYVSHAFQGELDFLGITSSPSFVASPEGNGIAERFIRTLKEQLLWVEYFDTVEDLRAALQAFRDRYNQQWLVARHGHLTPIQVRESLTEPTRRAA